MKYILDPETGTPVYCERCEDAPAVVAEDYDTDEGWRCDWVCAECMRPTAE